MNRTTTLAAGAYVAAIVTANLLVAHYGPGISVATAFVLIGLDLALRDFLHDAFSGALPMLALIVTAGAVSWLANPSAARIALASSAAFTLAALADWAVYAAARRWPWLARSNASNVAGAAVDSIAFPALAFGLPLLWPIVLGQFAAKTLGGALWSLGIAGGRRAAAHH